ncbi:MAG: SpoIIE family protein phosphatase [bacterium]|nr:SpoIIE family protein phosphatase [bacterium]
MNFIDNIYFNFISFGALISTLFLLTLGISLIRIKNRSKATFHLAVVFLWEAVHNLGYIFAFSVYDPIVAYHRWLSIIGVLPAIAHTAQFFFYYPNEKNPRLARIFLIAMYTTSIVLSGLFIRKSLIVDKIFFTDGQFWNVNEKTIGTTVALCIILFILLYIGIAIWRIITELNTTRKKNITAMLISTFIVVLAPAILNFLSKSGQMSKATFHTLWCLITIFGWFFVVIVYINTTTDKTSFMDKIIGISYVTLLVIMLVIGYFTLHDRENAYDDVHMQQLPRMLLDNDYRTDDLEYIIAYPHSEAPSFLEKKEGISIDFLKNYDNKKNDKLLITGFLKKDKEKQLHYKAYTLYVSKQKTLYEAGFSYNSYRQFVHIASLKLIGILIGTLLVILVGFRFFFFGTLVSPLRTLIEGLKDVGKGDLDINIPVKVKDEIGYLTHNFNTMVNTIKSGKEQIDDFIDNLEAKVDERTAELQKTLKEIRTLKVQQDGDYFLTSLLIEPLSKNQAACVNIDIDFFVKEKKQFQFRKWKKEIGGDICSSHNLFLKGRLYAVFLNADAMGKSIQGVGGALVLGAVLKSIIDRTRFSSIEQEQYPEQWIRNAYTELQRVFEGFDGSMLISIVLGLLDDETGLMYHLNAEHPWTVLYRNGKASFIEKQLLLRKLGFLVQEEEFLSVRTFQMEPGDVIIAGSDGRDDIIMQATAEHKIINEDETLFLKLVEEGKGILPDIYSAITGRGEITDDLSLLRIAFTKDEKTNEQTITEQKKRSKKTDGTSYSLEELEEAYTADRYNPFILKEMLKQLIRNKDYSGAVLHAEHYIEIRPGDTEFIYITSYCLMKTGKLKKAGELGERVHLRDPKNIKYLLHLAKIYMHVKKYLEADQLLDQVLFLDPENSKAVDLKHTL